MKVKTSNTEQYYDYTVGSYTYRQILPPGRTLKVGEILEPTDFYLWCDCVWRVLRSDGCKCYCGSPIPEKWAKDLCYRPFDKSKRLKKPVLLSSPAN